uniref:Uncharacterized protein n=1 Tax=Tanacetum cinerariifolium TaxID=118510 RepID=A0A6L2MC24_TANCI|nr:hypothetical protein [Tanacetum cinerariifolium]
MSSHTSISSDSETKSVRPSHKRCKSLTSPPTTTTISPPAPSAVAMAAAAPAYDCLEEMPLERVEEINDDIKTLQARLTSIEEEVMTMRGRAEWVEVQEGDPDVSSSKQQNKGHKAIMAHAVRPNNKKEYAGTLRLCNKCKFYHIGVCTANEWIIELEIVGLQFRERQVTPSGK